MRRLTATIAVAAASAVLAAPSGAATPVAREFSAGITAASSPSSIAAGPDGNLWFTEKNAGKIGRITTAGAVTEFPIPGGSGSQPTPIVAGPDGNLWFTESNGSNDNMIGRITPSGTVTQFPTDIAAFTFLAGITAGPDGNLWFTADAGVGKMTTSGTTPPVYTAGITGFPDEIVTGADGNLWFTEVDNLGSGHKIARITTSGVVDEFAIANEPTDIAAGPDGKLWFTQGPSFGIGRIDPNAPDPATTIARFTAGITGTPASIVAGPDGNLWFTESGDQVVGRITPSGTVTEFSAGITSAASPAGIAAGPDGNLWFTEFVGQRIARINTALDPMRYTDRARIEVPANGSLGDTGPAGPYPATIAASGLQGTVTEVSVRLNGLHHSWAGDVEALLVGPQGQTALLLADSLEGSTGDVITERVITFDDDGLTSPVLLVNGIFKPILGTGASATFAPPAPTGDHMSSLSVFDGTNPNGDWKLFVQDDFMGDRGVVAGGWSLDIQTTGPAPAQVPGPPVEVEVPGAPTTVTIPGPTVTVPGPTVTPPPDTTQPTLSLTGPAARTTLTAFRRGPRFTVTPSEAVTLDVTLSLKPKAVTIASADSILLYERTSSATNATAMIVKPSARLLGRPKRTFRVQLRIVASDAAGNRTTVTKTIRVNPDKRKAKRNKR
jgi:streptogramin lyase/subtilisin-like proprotein convertase family protein